MNHLKNIPILIATVVILGACQYSNKHSRFEGKKGEVKLMVLDPGHFHADLLLKKHNDRISQDIYVYAPKGVGLNQHLERVQSFNAREEDPTNWRPVVYDSDDFFEQMLKNPGGNVVVLAGNNQRFYSYSTCYIILSCC